jgi:hypothetical protein
MSVRTVADEKLEAFKKHLDNAIPCLSEIVCGRCWGHEDFSKEYHEKLKQSLIDCLEIRERLE